MESPRPRDVLALPRTRKSSTSAIMSASTGAKADERHVRFRWKRLNMRSSWSGLLSIYWGSRNISVPMLVLRELRMPLVV